MNGIIRIIKICITNWKKMLLEDKILFIQEIFCYFLALCTFVAVIYTINIGLMKGALILLFGVASFIGCGLNAKSSRDSYIIEHKVGNNKITRAFKVSIKKA